MYGGGIENPCVIVMFLMSFVVSEAVCITLHTLVANYLTPLGEGYFLKSAPRRN